MVKLELNLQLTLVPFIQPISSIYKERKNKLNIINKP